MSFVPDASRSACSPASSPSTTALICRAMVYTMCWLFQIKASSWQDIRSTYSKRRKRKSLRPLSASWIPGGAAPPPTARPHGWPSHFVRTRSQPSITVINKNMSMSVSLAASRSKCPRPLLLYIHDVLGGGMLIVRTRQLWPPPSCWVHELWVRSFNAAFD